MRGYLRLLLALLCTHAGSSVKTWSVNSKNLIVDETGRARVFHGVNAVMKTAPYYPTPESLNETDAQNLASWGFNMVRLGVLWEAVTPAKVPYMTCMCTSSEGGWWCGCGGKEGQVVWCDVLGRDGKRVAHTPRAWSGRFESLQGE